MVQLKKRFRSDTVRPSIEVDADTWQKFKDIFSNKTERDNLINVFLKSVIEKDT